MSDYIAARLWSYLESGHDVKVLLHVSAQHHAGVELAEVHELFRTQQLHL